MHGRKSANAVAQKAARPAGPGSRIARMLPAPPAPRPRTLAAALALSLIAHLGLLLIDLEQPPAPARSSTLEARLAPRPAAPRVDTRPPAQRAAAAPSRPRQAEPRPAKPKPAPAAPRILTARKPAERTRQAPQSTSTWSVAQKQEMDDFLDELKREARTKPQPQPQPDLAERSLAMAREAGRQAHREGSRSPQHDPAMLIERIAGSPPPDPFSLDFYLDSLLKKLNRSAAFVKSDPRSRGVQAAAIEVRINPDGSLKSFVVTRAGDQQAEIEFVKSVVERAVPFAAFPPDIVRSARSLGLMICIQPSSGGNGGFGFTRRPEGSGCG